MPDTERLTPLLAPIWRSEKPLYRALAQTLRGAIASGELTQGERLPSERELAAALGVSRSTVVSAYDGLREGGWVTSRGGSGTFVAPRSATAPPLRMHEMVAAEPGPGSPLGPPAVPAVVNLSVSKPRPLTELLQRALRQAAEELPGLASSVEYATAGLPRLQELVADTLEARGLPTVPGQVIVTSGAQQAIGLLARLFLRPGDLALVESPTYLGALDVLRAAEANLLALPASGGFDAAAAVALAERARPELAFLMPDCHTVTGAAIGADDRAALAALSAELQLPIIEDEIFADLTLAEERLPPIASFSDDAPVFTVGSLSKLVWNGLRVGWLRAPEAMVKRLVRMKSTADLGTSLLSQAVAANLLERRAEIIRLRRPELIATRAHASDLLRAAAPAWSWSPPTGGRSLWLRLPAGSATAFAEVAERHGVVVVPGPALSPDGGNDDHLRLMFVQPKATLEVAVRRLTRAWAEYRPR